MHAPLDLCVASSRGALTRRMTWKIPSLPQRRRPDPWASLRCAEASASAGLDPAGVVLASGISA